MRYAIINLLNKNFLHANEDFDDVLLFDSSDEAFRYAERACVPDSYVVILLTEYQVNLLQY